MLMELSIESKPCKKVPLTEPKEFNFHTSYRCIPKEKVLSFQEKEELEMKTIPKFKAAPLNKSIFKKVIGIPKITKKALTKQRGFNLSSSFVSRNNSCNSSQNNSTILFKAKPMPDFTKSFEPKLNHNFSVPEEFNLLTNKRGEDKRKKFEQMREESEKENRSNFNFHAKPAPSFYEPSERMSKEFEQQPTITFNFKARPMPSFNNPYKIEPANKELTVPHSPELSLNKRAGYWKEAEREKMRIRQLLEERGKELQQIQQRKEEEELRMYRESLVFKANPIRQGAPLVVKKSEKYLTIPHSPELSNSRFCKNSDI